MKLWRSASVDEGQVVARAWTNDRLEESIAAAEAQVPALRPRLAKQVIRFQGQRDRRPLAVVYLHGYTATLEESRPLCDRLAEELGAHLFYTRLAGHGQDGAAMGKASVEDWLQDARDACDIGAVLGERVVLVGCSTGSLLALWLALRDADSRIAALVLLSPNFRPRSRSAAFLALPFAEALVKAFIGPTFHAPPRAELHEKYWTRTYDSRALLTMMRLVRWSNSWDLSRLETPTLIAYSPRDQVVDAGLIERRFAQIGAATKKLLPITDSADPEQHLLVGDVLSPRTTEPLVQAALEFLRPALEAGRDG